VTEAIFVRIYLMIKSSKATFEAEAVLIYAKADCLFAVRFLLFGDVDGRREWKGRRGTI
jgi:hypothetical protein